MAKNIYRGFSSADLGLRRTFSLSNIELVKRDLLNHIYTIKGERLMMPDFGTRIPLLAFEPNDENTRSVVEEDLRAVFSYDPRVNLISLNVFSLESNNAIVALADLFYIEFNVNDILRLDIKTQ
jgi:phage baseplate assembly protein W